MAASNELEEARRAQAHDNRDAVTNATQPCRNHSKHLEANGDKENGENIPPSPRHDANFHSDSDTDSLKSTKSQTKAIQPRFETFMMTGDLIINLNAKTSNSSYVLPSTKRLDNIQIGQSSIPASPEEGDFRIRNKAPKREASNFRSPVAEKKGNYNYTSNFVRTSKSEDHLQNVSVAAVDIDIEDDITTSLHTLLDTKQENSDNDRIVWTYNAPVATEEKSLSSPTCSSPTSLRSSSSSSSKDSPSKTSSPKKKNCYELEEGDHNIPLSNLADCVTCENGGGVNHLPQSDSEPGSPTENLSPSKEHLRDEDWVAQLNTKETVINHELVKENIKSERSMFSSRQTPRTIQPKQDGVTNIIVDENKIYVKVFPDKTGIPEPRNVSLSKSEKMQNNMQLVSLTDDVKQQELRERRDEDSFNVDEESHHSPSPPTDDESDVDSLHSFHYSPKAVDMPSASRLAKRLYYLEGFKKSDVSRHLCKNNDFSRVVAEEYLKFFDFASDTLDIALRKFLKQFCLIGETQERERVLVHFSKRFLDCNPGSFKSQDAVHTLTCALMLLNTDLHGENVGRRMTCGEFIENLAELNDGENFPKEVLKSLYHSIKAAPLEWAVDDEDNGPTIPECHSNIQDNRQSFIGHNPFLEVPNPNCATEYKKGFVMRKCCKDQNGKRTPLGKRGWKMFYATLRDLVLYLHKDENGFRKNQLYDSLHNSIRIHHSLASKASDYTKKQHVIRLQTADQAEYLFQTGDSKELQSWIDTINFVAANLSAPPLASAVGSQKKFQRPLLPVTHTKLNFREQLQDHDNNVMRLEKELEEHQSHPPDKTAKSRVLQEYEEKEAYLQFEVKRYRTYAYLLRSKIMQFPELELPLVETSIGEVDEPTERSDSNTSPVHKASTPHRENTSKRALSDRYSYRAAIYKTTNGEDSI